MKLIANGPILAHQEDGTKKEYAEGDEINVTEAKGKWLIDSGSATTPAEARKAAKADGIEQPAA